MTQGTVALTIGAFHLEAAWSVAPGEVLVLYGPSGAGKSLTLRSVAGLIRPDRGHIEVAGKTVYDSESGVDIPPERRNIGYIPQHYGLFPHLSVRDNIAYGLHGLPRAVARDRVDEALSAFHLAGLERRLPHQLSGGQQQRVAIARAMATQPGLLLLDEPFSALDEDLRRSARQEVAAQLKARPVPVILVTHDRADVLSLGSRILALDRGRVVAAGLPDEVLENLSPGRAAPVREVDNVLLAQAEEYLPQQGLVRCRLGEFILFASLKAPTGPRGLRLGLRSDRVVLSEREPLGLVGANILPGRVDAIHPESGGVAVDMECAGAVLRLRIPLIESATLGLHLGQAVWAVVPVAALMVLDE